MCLWAFINVLLRNIVRNPYLKLIFIFGVVSERDASFVYCAHAFLPDTMLDNKQMEKYIEQTVFNQAMV